jgi:hypothetical protein
MDEGHRLCREDPPEVQGPVEETGSMLCHRWSIAYRAPVVPGDGTAEGQALEGRKVRNMCEKFQLAWDNTGAVLDLWQFQRLLYLAWCYLICL